MSDYAHLAASVFIPLPWTRQPLSQNDRGSWHGKHRVTQAAIVQAGAAIRAAGVQPITGARVILHLWAKDRRRRDTDNLAPTLKACMDALVDEGILPDDSWVHVPFSGCAIHGPTPDLPHGARYVLELAPCDPPPSEMGS